MGQSPISFKAPYLFKFFVFFVAMNTYPRLHSRANCPLSSILYPLSSEPHVPTLGLCISTQRQVADLDGVRRMIAAVRDSGARVLGIPMNIKTDRTLLESLGVECIPGTTPEAVMNAAVACDVVLSSRLHLLILAANAGTPGLGIARGSKLANWLANFGRTVEGSVSDCDWKKVTDHVLAALKDRGDWDAVRAAAYGRLNARLETARGEFIKGLEGCHGL